MFTAALAEALPALRGDDLAGMEQRLRRVGRAVLGPVVERVVAARAAGVGGGACPDAACAGPLRLVDRARPRHLHGLVGDDTLRRAYYRCATCGRGQAPLDDTLGLGTGSLAPGLAQVVCREGGAQGSFAEAVDSVAASVGVALTAEVARRATEGMGAVAEAETQAAMARVARGQPAWAPADAAVEAAESAVLAVEVDGVYVQRDDGWHEMKVVTVAPRGPGVETDADTGRERLCWGRASDGAGVEEAQDFGGRAHAEACRRGLGTPAVRTVVALGDGAPWIWRHARAYLARAYLALPGVAVVEISDLYHADAYLWSVGNAVFGEGRGGDGGGGGGGGLGRAPQDAAVAGGRGPAPRGPGHARPDRVRPRPRRSAHGHGDGGHRGDGCPAGARVCDHQRRAPGLSRLPRAALAHRLGWAVGRSRETNPHGRGREWVQEPGPGAHQGGRQALERRRRSTRHRLAGAAPLGPLGRLLAGPAATCPPAPGPPCAPAIHPHTCGASCDQTPRGPHGPHGPTTGGPAYPPRHRGPCAPPPTMPGGARPLGARVRRDHHHPLFRGAPGCCRGRHARWRR